MSICLYVGALILLCELLLIIVDPAIEAVLLPCWILELMLNVWPDLIVVKGRTAV